MERMCQVGWGRLVLSMLHRDVTVASAHTAVWRALLVKEYDDAGASLDDEHQEAGTDVLQSAPSAIPHARCRPHTLSTILP